MRRAARELEEGPWRLRLDLATTRGLLWVAGARGPRDLPPLLTWAVPTRRIRGRDVAA
jgi:hypothetical protein